MRCPKCKRPPNDITLSPGQAPCNCEPPKAQAGVIDPPRTYWLAKIGMDGYANPTEPKLYPHAFVAMVKKAAYEKIELKFQNYREGSEEAFKTVVEDKHELSRKLSDCEKNHQQTMESFRKLNAKSAALIAAIKKLGDSPTEIFPSDLEKWANDLAKKWSDT